MIKKDNLYYDSHVVVNKLKFSTSERNDHYRVGPEGEEVFLGTPLIAWTTAVWIGDTRQIWLRGKLWNVDSGVSFLEMSEKLQGKQDALVSGVNLKTVNGVSMLGEGDIKITKPAYRFSINLEDGCLYASEVSVENS